MTTNMAGRHPRFFPKLEVVKKKKNDGNKNFFMLDMYMRTAIGNGRCYKIVFGKIQEKPYGGGIPPSCTYEG